jgi:hypothetical protein
MPRVTLYHAGDTDLFQDMALFKPGETKEL